MLLIWTIALASLLLMLLRPKGIPEYIWIGAGAVLLVIARLLPLPRAVHALHEALDVCLFLIGMMLLAELARHEGVFDWVADLAVHHAKGSAARLFLWIYGAGVVVTALLSNDATAVVLTPAVLAAVRRARVEPRPYLLACALIANAASFLLPISNPANLVIFGSHLPPLGSWMRSLLLPSIVSIAATYLCLRWLSRRTLRGTVSAVEDAVRLTPAGKLALAGILLAAATLLASSAFELPLGLPTCIAGIVALALVALRDRSAPRAALRHVSWSIIPLVAGLFMIVEALNLAGMLRATLAGLHWLAALPGGYGKLIGAFTVALLSNGMNNLPVGLAGGTALAQMHNPALLTHAVLIGVDLGPNLSVTGSLATILWLIALRRDNAEITAWEFLKTGALVMPVSLLLTLLALR
ncbi:arsenic transporter [Paracidobacterium acidisoli]|uniref:Arsenic transporter n=1 Tax=Paracidobacterium acidisoli TaxID=2303751 RepID=A0A372IQW5_9BACT|nr:arsenic transporter [Paracidobacterium acidisoli]MBT9331468.1 arsenic transporter [Paracidobacterium acidisoli]